MINVKKEKNRANGEWLPETGRCESSKRGTARPGQPCSRRGSAPAQRLAVLGIKHAVLGRAKQVTEGSRTSAVYIR